MKTEHKSMTEKHMKTSHTYRTKATDEEQHIKTEKWRWNWWISQTTIKI